MWKSGVTVLVYKKGGAGNPESFRPITLQSVLSKVFIPSFKIYFSTSLRKTNTLK